MSNINNMGNIYNEEQMDNRSIYDLSNYGRAMKFYAIGKLIWTVFSFILVFVLQSSIFGLLELTESEMMENAGSIMLLFLFVLVGGAGGGIFIIVRYIIYVLKLNKASNSSLGVALRTIFYIEIAVFAGYIISAFLTIPEAIYVDLIIFSLLIASTIYLGKWVNSLPHDRIDENKKSQMIFWIRFMGFGLIVKFGEIVRLFASTSLDSLDSAGIILTDIGDILLIIGMLKTANAIMTTFNRSAVPQSQYSMDMRNRGPVQRPHPEKVQYPPRSNMPSTTINSPGTNNICPYCGSPIIDAGSKFCAVCGKKRD